LKTEVAPTDPSLSRPRLRPNRTLAFLVLLSVIPAVSWPTNTDKDSWLQLAQLVLYISTGVLVGVWYLLYGAFKRRTQLALNDKAALLATSADPFVLYLRPFVTSGRLLVRNSLPNFADRLLLGRWWDLELALALALEDMMPMVAIGETRHTFGAAKIRVPDSTWKERFLELARSAKLIVMVPSERPGTIWEIESIQYDAALRSKSLFVMPPAQTTLRRLLSPHRWFSEARIWRRASTYLKDKHGITLPHYDRRGGFFALGAKGETVAFWLPGDFNDDYVAMICRVVMAGSAGILPSERREMELAFLSDSVQRVQRLEPESWWRTWSAPLTTLLFVLPLTFLIFRTVLYQPFDIPTGSMKPTLETGDVILASKIAYGYNRFSIPLASIDITGRLFASHPKRGDLVIFKLPRDNALTYVKRVVGLPGDEIQMKDGVLYINGQAVPKVRKGEFLTREEDGVPRRVPTFEETLPNGVKYTVLDSDPNGQFDNTRPYKVPPGHYFTMGDNRDNSTDSRATWGVGYIPFENIYARADLILYSRTKRALTQIH